MAEPKDSRPVEWRDPRTLPDGRTVEALWCAWGTDEPDDPPGMVPVEVSFTVDGVLQTRRVLLRAAEVVNALGGGVDG